MGTLPEDRGHSFHSKQARDLALSFYEIVGPGQLQINASRRGREPWADFGYAALDSGNRSMW